MTNTELLNSLLADPTGRTKSSAGVRAEVLRRMDAMPDARALAERIASDLFSGGNFPTERLVQRSDSLDRYGGGWSEKPMADRIELHLLGKL